MGYTIKKNSFSYSDQLYDRHIPFIAEVMLVCLGKLEDLPEGLSIAECLTTFDMCDVISIPTCDSKLYNALFKRLLAERRGPKGYKKASHASLWVQGMSKLIHGIYKARGFHVI